MSGLSAIGKMDVHALRDEFSAAAGAGDVAACAEIMNHFGSANVVVDHGGVTMLMVAARSGSVAICEMLLKRGASVSAQDDRGRTALFMGVASADVCRLLIAHGADINVSCTADDMHYFSPIEAAAGLGHLESCKVLVGCGQSLSPTDRRSSLDAAAGARKFEVLDFLLQTWPEDAPARLSSMFVDACSLGALNTCEDLLQRGADANNPEALIAAITSRRMHICDFLYERGVDVNGLGQQGITALHAAAMVGTRQGATWLLEHGANVNAESQRAGWTPLYAAIQKASRDNGEMCALLVKAGADVAPVCGSAGSYTPFQYAVKLGKLGAVRFFVEEVREDVNQLTFAGATMPELAGPHQETRAFLLSVQTAELVGQSLSATSEPEAPKRKRPSGPLPF